MRWEEMRWEDVRGDEVRGDERRWGAMRSEEMRGDEVRGDEASWGEMGWSEMRWDQVRWGEVGWGEVRWCEIKWDGVRWGEIKTWDEVRWGEMRRDGVRWGERRWEEMRWEEVRGEEMSWEEVGGDEVRRDEGDEVDEFGGWVRLTSHRFCILQVFHWKNASFPKPNLLNLNCFHASVFEFDLFRPTYAFVSWRAGTSTHKPLSGDSMWPFDSLIEFFRDTIHGLLVSKSPWPLRSFFAAFKCTCTHDSLVSARRNSLVWRRRGPSQPVRCLRMHGGQ